MMKTGAARILVYHAVSEDDDFPTDSGTNVTPAAFEEQLAYITARFEVLPLEKIVEGEGGWGRPAVALTFDDGYEDSFLVAYPILRKHRVPATFFLTVSRVGKDWPFPRGPYPGLSWEQVRRMHGDPLIGIGSHGCRHVNLTTIPPAEAAGEIKSSKHILEEKLSCAIRFFSYPFGSYNDEVKGAVRRAGYRAAFSVISGGRDAYDLRRSLVSRKDTMIRFKLKLSPLYRVLRGLLRAGSCNGGRARK